MSNRNLPPTPYHLPQDQRHRLLGVTDAARLLGRQRTQVWRYAHSGLIPCIVVGTAKRPRYLFHREDLIAFRDGQREAREGVARKRRRKAQPALRNLLHLMRTGQITLGDLPQIPSRVR